jgi:S-adenosylmethionine:tRNA ribosyltransferase-isomerase
LDSKASYIPDINPDDYYYELPKDRIAEFPLPNRADSRLLVADTATHGISHHKFSDIKDFLPQDALLVLNSTKVIAARLNMVKNTGGRAEILCVEPVEPSVDPQVTMAARQRCVWKCIIGGPRVRKDTLLEPEHINNSTVHLKARILQKEGNDALVEFSWQPTDLPFASVIELTGNIPLPPYIKRAPVESDAERYQTVYAHYEGSVAAPTAGLHFTGAVLDELRKKHIAIEEVTLHVGPGTFKPID